MPRYLIERSFPDGLTLPGLEDDAQTRLEFIENNTLDGVTWVHSFVVADGKKTYCVYDAPTPEALRRAARRNGLPIDRILEVSMLEPYFYLAKASLEGPISGRGATRRPKQNEYCPQGMNTTIESGDEGDWRA